MQNLKTRKRWSLTGKTLYSTWTGYKRILLEGLIEEHNKRSLWERAERIELKTEE